jgi:hypothetical protein
MSNPSKSTVTLRREFFLRDIRTQQRETFKEERRARLIEHALQVDQLWQFRKSILTLDLRFEEAKVARVPSALSSFSNFYNFTPTSRISAILLKILKWCRN